MNCTGTESVEVRTAGCEKWLQSPDPARKPKMTNETMTTSFVPVSTF